VSIARTAAVVFLGILLTLTLAGGNIVFAAHGSVLDPGFVTETLEEEDGYAAFTEQMRAAVRNATDGGAADGQGDGVFGSLIEGQPIQDAVTPAYVESQVDPNVQTVYAYLHGNSRTLNLTLDTRPLAENAGENVAQSIRNSTVSELVTAAPGDPFEELPVEASFVAELNDGPESYAAAKSALRSDIRTEIVDARVDAEFEDATNDQLLALVIPDYDPDEYTEAEKRQMVDEREPEIRDAIRQRIEQEADGQIETAVENRLDTFRERAASGQPTADAVGDEDIATAVSDLQLAVVTGATTDQSYEAYRANVTSARDELGSAMGGFLTQQMNNEVGIVDLNEAMDIPREGALEQPRTIVGYLDLSAIVIPILGLLLIGGVWFLSRSAVTTAATLGVSLLLASIPALIGVPIAADRVRGELDLEGEAAETLGPIIEGLLQGVVDTVTGQALLLALIGLGSVGVAVGIHYGLDERLREEWSARKGQ